MNIKNDYFRTAVLRSTSYLHAMRSEAANDIQRAQEEEGLFELLGSFDDAGKKVYRCPDGGVSAQVHSPDHAAMAWVAAARGE